MNEVVRAVESLFEAMVRVAENAGIGLFQHGVAKVTHRALGKFNLGGVGLAYQSLSAADKAVVDEVVEYFVRFGAQYWEHHDERSRFRLDHSDDIAAVLYSHAEEWVEAAFNAGVSRFRSHAYDYVALHVSGPFHRKFIFHSEDVVKQFVQASVDEMVEHIYAQFPQERPMGRVLCSYCRTGVIDSLPGTCPFCFRYLTRTV